MASQTPSELPTEVHEQDTSKTSVYTQGKLVYDGATGEWVGSSTGEVASQPPTSLNEMLKWGISNSDPAELERRAAQGARPPAPIDREIMDMLMGQPIVASMRACLTKLAPDAIEEVDAAIGGLEELEYYVEDIDNAVDLAKIGGIQVLLECCANTDCDPEIREAACGVIATAVQNNPKVQEAALNLEVPQTLLTLLRDEDTSESLPIKRKALYALSALMRSSEPGIRRIVPLPGMMDMLVDSCAHSDAKLRRRALFLLHVLCSAHPEVLQGLGTMVGRRLFPALVEASCDADEDTRQLGIQMLLLFSKSDTAPKLAAQMRELEAVSRLKASLEAVRKTGSDGNPEHITQLEELISFTADAA